MVLRNNSEKPSLGYSANFNVKYQLNDSWDIVFGLGKYMVKERCVYNYKDTVRKDSLFFLKASFENTYTFIQLPISFLYTKEYSWIDVGFYSGIGLNFLQKVNAAIPTVERTAFKKLSMDDIPVIGLSLQTGLQVKFPISNALSFYILPGAQFQVNSLLKSDFNVRQFPYSYGLSAGIYCRL